MPRSNAPTPASPSGPTPVAGPGGPCSGCPYAERKRLFCHWPHRCVFQGNNVEAWLVGMSGEDLPLVLCTPASLLLTVTHGDVEVESAGETARLGHGQSLALPRGAEARIHSGVEADVLLVLSFVDGARKAALRSPR